VRVSVSWFGVAVEWASVAGAWLANPAQGSLTLFALGNLSPEGLMAMLLLGLVFGVVGAVCWPGLWWAGPAGLLAGLVTGSLLNAWVDLVPRDLLSDVVERLSEGP